MRQRSEWLRDREQHLDELVRRGQIRLRGIRRCRIDLRPLGRLAWHYDAERDAFYVALPAPFAHLRLYEVMDPTLTEWAPISVALQSFGIWTGE